MKFSSREFLFFSLFKTEKVELNFYFPLTLLQLEFKSITILSSKSKLAQCNKEALFLWGENELSQHRW